MTVSIRDQLDDECRDCGKHIDAMDSVHPVARPSTLPSFTGEVVCGGCMPDE